MRIDYVAPQNEPNYALGYPTCLWNSADYAKFVGQYLGPALASTTTKLMLGTSSNKDSGKDTTVVTSVMGDATAKTFPKVVGLQWGMLDNYEANSSMYKTYGLPVWATEHMCGNYPWNPSGSPSYVEPAPNDFAYGVESWGYLAKAIRGGVTAYNAWNMVLDTMGKGNDSTRQWAQDALLTVNTSSKTLNITPAYYVFRHFSQFAQPGAQVVVDDRWRLRRIQESGRQHRGRHVQLGIGDDRTSLRSPGRRCSSRCRPRAGRPSCRSWRLIDFAVNQSTSSSRSAPMMRTSLPRSRATVRPC